MTTSVTYPADGIDNLYAVPFPYIDSSHVFVKVDGSVLPSSGYVWDTPSSIRTNEVYAAGRSINIYRQTPEAPLVQYQSGSTVTQEDLETDSLQALYRIEEVESQNDLSIQLAPGTTGVSTELPAPEAGLLIGWNADGSALRNVDVDPNTAGDLLLRADLADPTAGTDLVTYQSPAGVARSLSSKLDETISVFDFIPTSEHAAIRARTSLYDCTADIQAAIDAVAAQEGGVLFFPPGWYKISDTLTVNDSNVTLQGSGGGGYENGTATTQNSAATRIYWDPAVTAAVGQPMVLFAHPGGSVQQQPRGGGLNDLMLDGMATASVGYCLRSVHATHNRRVVIFGCRRDHFLLEAAEYPLLSTAGATQHNVFEGCVAISFGGSGWYLNNWAPGWRLRSGSLENPGDASINTFIGCYAFMSLGSGWVVEGCGQDYWLNCFGGALGSTPTVSNVATVLFPTAGSLGAGTYSYRVAPVYESSQAIFVEGPASTAVTRVISSGTTNRIQVTWDDDPDAVSYRVYGRTGGNEKLIAEVAGNFNYFYDSGTAVPSGDIPSGVFANQSYGMILGANEQDTSTGAHGVARHHVIVGGEIRIFACAGQSAGNGSSFGNIIFGASQGDALWAPVVLQTPQGGADLARCGFYSSGNAQGFPAAVNTEQIVVRDLTVSPQAKGHGTINIAADYYVRGDKVVGGRSTGWVDMTGTANKGTVYDTGAVTLQQLATRVKALQDALSAHGLLGA